MFNYYTNANTQPEPSDYDIDNWSLDDIYELFDLPDEKELTEDDIYEKTDIIIDHAKRSGDKKIVNFLIQARQKLLSNSAQNTSQIMIEPKKVEVENSYVLPKVRDTLNPTLKNQVSRILSIDSQYRPNIYPFSYEIDTPSFNTEFTVNLSEPLTNVMEIELYSIQIPKSWYNIDTFFGNNTISINSVLYTLKPGQYTANTITTALNNLLPSNIIFSYNELNRKISIQNNTGGNVEVVLYDMSNSSLNISNSYTNNSLGWVLGFRPTPTNNNKTSSFTLSMGETKQAESIINLDGPQYCMIVVDDYNNNRLNKGIISSSKLDTNLKMPSYTNQENEVCDDPSTNSTFFVQSTPRKLTQAQLYTINSIKSDRKEFKSESTSPTTDNVLAIIPITNEIDVITRYGVDLSKNKRTYFGPVDIQRLKIKLVDDKGNLLNLNGRDWSFSLNITQLYQY